MSMRVAQLPDPTRTRAARGRSRTFRVRVVAGVTAIVMLVLIVPVGWGEQSARADEAPTPSPGAAAAAIHPAPVPTITGTARIGSRLVGEVGVWAPDVELTYRWLADGVAVPGATGPTFTPSLLRYGQRLTFEVRGSRPGSGSVVRTSTPTAAVAGAPFPVSAAPTVVGTPRVGEVLSVRPGSWSPTPRLTYQWRANGVAIPGATGATYALRAADRTRTITVTARATRPRYQSQVRESARTAQVAYGQFASTPTPTISGLPEVGGAVTAGIGTWAPAATLTYQWRANGVALPGATGRTYRVSAAVLGTSLTVVVRGARDGYVGVTRTSAATTKVTQPFLVAPTPKISAQLVRVGWPLTVTAGTWSPAANLSLQWYRNSVAIPGAVGSTYRLRTTDLGARITVTVVAHRSGYTTRSRSSAATSVVLAAPYGFTDTGTPATPPAAAYAPATIKLITDPQWARITAAGVWRSGCPGTRATFRRVEVPYWGFDGKTHRGYVIVNADVSRSTVKIFDEIYAKRFPLHRVEGIENFDGWDWLASKGNVSTALNCRKPSEANSPNAYSPHAWGRALDFNPVQNPYINPRTGTWDPNPPPSGSAPGTIRYGGTVWTIVTSKGWRWSGTESWRDYMHFDTGYPSTARIGLSIGLIIGTEGQLN